ncbi:MAG: aldo/keto reductase, partial [Turicibacter sp.]
MQYRHFKKLGLDISLLGFGCMRFPTIADGTIDEVESQKMIDYAYEQGVNYFDTAWMYHGIGVSERFVGKALAKYPRESFYLADKFPLWEVKSEEDIEKIFNEQLERLNVEYIDFYLIHALSGSRWQEVLDYNLLSYLEKWKAEGKIKYIGFSFHDDLEGFKTVVNGYDKWEFCQIQLNYMDTNHQQGMEGYDILVEKEIPCLIMEPLKGGALSQLPDEVKRPFTELEPDSSVSSWALRYVANLPGVHIILSGMS